MCLTDSNLFLQTFKFPANDKLQVSQAEVKNFFESTCGEVRTEPKDIPSPPKKELAVKNF